MLSFQPSTFVFEILNFFVLLVVLQRFLYRPLLRVMQQREDDIAARLHAADERTRQADVERQSLAEQARGALAAQTADHQRAIAEAARERDALLAHARGEAARMVEEAQQRTDQQERAARQRLDLDVRQSAVRIAGQLIIAAAGPAVHMALLDRLLDATQKLMPAERELLARGLAEGHGQVTLELAYPSTDDLDARVRAVLDATSPSQATITMQTRVEADLMAGARIVAGTVALDLSLRGELQALTSAPVISAGGVAT